MEKTEIGFFEKIRKSINQKPWYKIENKGNSKAQIEIYDDIGGFFFGLRAKDFSKQLKALGKIDEIDLHINSNGGDAFEGMAIYEMLRSNEARVHVYVDGIAASVASVIAMAGDDIKISENGFMMIHMSRGFAFGTSKQMRKHAELLDKIDNNIINTYMTRVKVKREEVETLLNEETWMNADEAIEKGFADEKTEPLKAAAFAGDRYFNFNNIPLLIQNMIDTSEDDAVTEETKEKEVKTEEEVEMKEEEVKAMIEASVNPIQTSLDATRKENEALKGEIANLKASNTIKTQETKKTSVENRLNTLVSNQKITPTERDSFVTLLCDIDDDTKIDSFIKTLENRKRVAEGVLVKEVTLGNGERRSIVIDKNFTAPRPSGGDPKTPSVKSIALYDAINEDCESDEDFRKRAYAAYGERMPSKISQEQVEAAK